MLPASCPAFGAFLNAVELLTGDLSQQPAGAENPAFLFLSLLVVTVCGCGRDEFCCSGPVQPKQGGTARQGFGSEGTVELGSWGSGENKREDDRTV